MGCPVYKNIAYNKQTGFGISIGVGSVYLPVINFAPNKDVEATPVSETTNTPKGLRRAVNIKDTIEGNATWNVDMINVGYWTGLGFGGGVTVAAVGTSASAYTFFQSSNCQLTSARFDVDKAGSIEAYQDIFATEYTLSASDGLIEGSVTVTGSRQIAGATFTPTITDTRVLTFANAQWYYGNTIGSAGATIEVPVTDWSLTYRSGGEGKFQSGANYITRQDLNYASLEINMTRFFDGSSGALVARDNVYVEDGERGMRLVLTSDSDNTIVGSTPYVMTFGIPKVKLMTSERTYNAGEQVVETITGQGLVDDTSGAICEPVLITRNGLTF